MSAEFIAFAGDEATLASLRGWAERQGFSSSAVRAGGAEAFAEYLGENEPPKFALVDLDGTEDPAAAAGRVAQLAGSACRLVAVGSANDVSLYRRMRAAGISDYLVKPLSASALAETYAAALRGGDNKSEARDAKIVVVLGSRGGAGASTVAVNTGWLLAHEFNLNCVLLDLDLQYGTSALSLDIEPGRGLRDIVSSPQRVDGLMIASSMVQAGEKLSVLGAEESIEDAAPADGEAIMALLKEMRSNFDFILVDLPRHMFSTQKRLLAAAHEIVLVAEMSLAGIRDALRIRNALRSIGTAATVTLAASRTNASEAGQIDRASFEKGVQAKIDLLIPEDAKSVSEAANSGKPLGQVAADSPATRALRGLAAKLSGKSAAASGAKKNPLGGLLGMLGGGKKKKGEASKEAL